MRSTFDGVLGYNQPMQPVVVYWGTQGHRCTCSSLLNRTEKPAPVRSVRVTKALAPMHYWHFSTSLIWCWAALKNSPPSIFR